MGIQSKSSRVLRVPNVFTVTTIVQLHNVQLKIAENFITYLVASKMEVFKLLDKRTAFAINMLQNICQKIPYVIQISDRTIVRSLYPVHQIHKKLKVVRNRN